MNQVICGDSLVLLKTMEENSVELVVTSPPYNVGIGYDVCDDARPLAEYHDWLRTICQELYRVIKPNCNVFINICDIGVSNRDASGENKIGTRGNFYVIPNHIVIVEEMRRIGAQYLHPIFWKKPSNHSSQFGANARFCGTYPYPRNCHVPSEVEYILHFRKNGIWKKVDKAIKEQSKVSKERWLELSSQIWEFNGTSNREHPAQFPVELPLRCIDGWSFVGDLVLDPFAGAGNTLVACERRKRKYLGFDISPEYCELARKRIDGEKNVGLFSEEAPL